MTISDFIKPIATKFPELQSLVSDSLVEKKKLKEGVSRLLEAQVVLRGPDNINRAIDGDVVVVQVFSKDRWVKYADDATNNIATAAETSDDFDEEIEPESIEPTIDVEEHMEIAQNNVKPVGRVVGIIQRNWGKYCGNIVPPRVKAAMETGGSCLVLPENRKIPRIKIRTRQQEFLMNKRIVASR